MPSQGNSDGADLDPQHEEPLDVPALPIAPHASDEVATMPEIDPVSSPHVVAPMGNSGSGDGRRAAVSHNTEGADEADVAAGDVAGEERNGQSNDRQTDRQTLLLVKLQIEERLGPLFEDNRTNSSWATTFFLAVMAQVCEREFSFNKEEVNKGSEQGSE